MQERWESGLGCNMKKVIRSGIVEYSIYHLLLVFEVGIFLVRYVNQDDLVISFSSFIYSNAMRTCGWSIVTVSFPITLIFMAVVFCMTASVNADFLSKCSYLLVFDIIGNIALYLRLQPIMAEDFFDVQIIKMILWIIMMVKNKLYSLSVSYFIGSKDKKSITKLVAFSKKVSDAFATVLLVCLFGAICFIAVCIVFEIRWPLVFVIAFGLALFILIDISEFHTTIKEMNKSQREQERFCKYDDEFARSNGINYARIIGWMIILLLLPLTILYTIGIICITKHLYNNMLNTIWGVVYIIFLLGYCYWYKNNYYLVEMKNVYYEKTKSGSVNKHCYDDSESCAEMNELAIVSEDDTNWRCNYIEEGQSKSIHVPKAYPGLERLWSRKTGLFVSNGLDLIRREKDIRNTDFNKGVSTEQKKMMRGSVYEQLITYYDISNGFRINGDYVFLSYEESKEETVKLRHDVKKTENVDISSDWIVVASVSDGDRVIMNSSGRVLEIDHDSLDEIIVEWKSVEDFLVSTLESGE